MDEKILKIVYTFFLGVIIALFVGLGISTFYEGPKAPEYPVIMQQEKEPSEEVRQTEREFEAEMRSYEQRHQDYSRNVSIIALVSAVVLLATSFLMGERGKVLANGIMLGGLFTLIYAIIRAAISQDTRYTFVAVAIGLVVVLYLGYRRFEALGTAKAAKK